MKRLLPAYPLWVIDPNFSVWSPCDELNGGDAIFWTGLSRRTYGFVRANGKTYCFLGRRDGACPMRQTDVSMTAFGTQYTFAGEGFTLKVEFVSPLPPDDLDLLSCPVCYTEYEAEFEGEMPEDFSVALALDEEYCYNNEPARVVGGVLPLKGYEAAFMTRMRNLVMSNADDIAAPDWGDVYLAGEESFFITDAALNIYLSTGKAEYVRKERERNYLFSLSRAQKGYFMTAFDDKVSIFYFGEWLKGYYFRTGKTIISAMDDARAEHERVLAALARFDGQLRADCDAVGEGYYLLACASLRQCVGAHKLVQNGAGELLFLSKECDSNGCIGTADVSYPSIPLFLIYNPKLVNAMMTGIYDFAKMPVWTFDFAPHDIGTYPWCMGQAYGVRNADDKYSCNQTMFWDYPRTHTMLYLRPAASEVYDFKYQMPVEECGNMLIMTAAALLAGADTQQAKRNFPLLTTSPSRRSSGWRRSPSSARSSKRASSPRATAKRRSSSPPTSKISWGRASCRSPTARRGAIRSNTTSSSISCSASGSSGRTCASARRRTTLRRTSATAFRSTRAKITPSRIGSCGARR